MHFFNRKYVCMKYIISKIHFILSVLDLLYIINLSTQLPL